MLVRQHLPFAVKRTVEKMCCLTTYRTETVSSFARLPDYLSSINYRNPDDPENSLFHFASGMKINMFKFMQTQPDMMEIFSKGMAASVRLQGSHLPGSISDLFPLEPNRYSPGESASYDKQPISGRGNDLDPLSKERSDENHILVVDVGGGRGSILQDLRHMRPDLQGRLIVQDLAKEIDGREITEGVEGMTFDFMQLQPVKGPLPVFIFPTLDSKAYHLLHHRFLPGRKKVSLEKATC